MKSRLVQDITRTPAGVRESVLGLADSQLGTRYRNWTIRQIIHQQWWGGNRSLDDVRVMVENTRLMIGLVERKTGRLVGYCRAITDFVFVATIYDVMVVQDLQGTGLGKRLMEQICHHPRLQRVSIMYLACEPALAAFYRRWGFRAYDERAQWMIMLATPCSAATVGTRTIDEFVLSAARGHEHEMTSRKFVSLV